MSTESVSNINRQKLAAIASKIVQQPHYRKLLAPESSQAQTALKMELLREVLNTFEDRRSDISLMSIFNECRQLSHHKKITPSHEPVYFNRRTKHATILPGADCILIGFKKLEQNGSSSFHLNHKMCKKVGLKDHQPDKISWEGPLPEENAQFQELQNKDYKAFATEVIAVEMADMAASQLESRQTEEDKEEWYESEADSQREQAKASTDNAKKKQEKQKEITKAQKHARETRAQLAAEQEKAADLEDLLQRKHKKRLKEAEREDHAAQKKDQDRQRVKEEELRTNRIRGLDFQV